MGAHAGCLAAVARHASRQGVAHRASTWHCLYGHCKLARTIQVGRDALKHVPITEGHCVSKGGAVPEVVARMSPEACQSALKGYLWGVHTAHKPPSWASVSSRCLKVQ